MREDKKYKQPLQLRRACLAVAALFFTILFASPHLHSENRSSELLCLKAAELPTFTGAAPHFCSGEGGSGSQQQESNINFTSETPVLVILKDVDGNEMYSKVILTYRGNKMVKACDQLSKLPSGTYFVIGSSDDSIYHHHMMVE